VNSLEDFEDVMENLRKRLEELLVEVKERNEEKIYIFSTPKKDLT